MVVQGQWDKDSLLLQVPHFTHELVETLKQEKKVSASLHVLFLSLHSIITLLCVWCFTHIISIAFHEA